MTKGRLHSSHIFFFSRDWGASDKMLQPESKITLHDLSEIYAIFTDYLWICQIKYVRYSKSMAENVFMCNYKHEIHRNEGWLNVGYYWINLLDLLSCLRSLHFASIMQLKVWPSRSPYFNSFYHCAAECNSRVCESYENIPTWKKSHGIF